MTAKCIYFMIFWTKNEISNFDASLLWVFPKNSEPVINISWLKNGQVKVCFFTLESPYQYFCCNLRHNVMPYMYSEMQNKLSKTRESPLESMGQIISSRCPAVETIRGMRTPTFCICENKEADQLRGISVVLSLLSGREIDPRVMHILSWKSFTLSRRFEKGKFSVT